MGSNVDVRRDLARASEKVPQEKENNLPPEDTLLKAINYRDKFSRKWLFIRRIKGKA